MKQINFERIGAQTALLVGIPIATLFSFLILIFSIYPLFDIGYYLIGGNHFWYPIIWAIIFPSLYILLLWKSGKRICKHINKNYSILKASIILTLNVNAWIFLYILMVFITSITLFNSSDSNNINLISMGITFLSYIITTLIITFTIGLIIVKLTKNRVADLIRIN